MNSEKHNPFDLNRTEYADLLGVSPNCIRMRLRQKKLEGQYIFENGKYLFKAPDSFGKFEVKQLAGCPLINKFEAGTSILEMRNFNQKSSSLLANE